MSALRKNIFGRDYKPLMVLCSFLVCAIGIWVLVCSFFIYRGITSSVLPNNLPMAGDSAACFILAGISLFLYLVIRIGPYRRVPEALAVLLALWPFLIFLKYIFYGVLLLQSDIFSLIHYGMSPQTAFCFFCLGISFLYIDDPGKRKMVQGGLHLVTFIGFIVLIGYLYNIPELHHLFFGYSMAIYAAVAFLIISAGASFMNPTVGLTGLFTGRMIGNIMARQLFFQIAAAILLTGYLRMLDHTYGTISPKFSSALVVVIFIFVVLSLIWRASKALNAIEFKRKQAQKSFRMAVELAPYALIMADQCGVIKLVNKQAEKIYGYTRQELKGRLFWDIIPASRDKCPFFDGDLFFDGEIGMKEFSAGDGLVGLRKNGSEFPVEVTMIPFEALHEKVVLTSIIDVTVRRNNEQIIKRQLIDLQYKNQELEQFNYIASHDLQEPLRTLSNYMEFLEEEYPDRIEGEIREHFHTMQAAVQRMGRLITSLLDFGKVGRGRRLTLTNTSGVLHDAIADLGGLIKKKHACIEVCGNWPVLYAYETELGQLFLNLIGNALKFVHGRVPPHIIIGVREAGGFFEFYVTDNGIGIPEGHFQDIFHIFQRLDDGVEFEGYGIGLANCKKIAEMHGGRIWVASEVNKGSTFSFTILNLKDEERGK
jgi:PAS domain S-box-containing protein